MNVVEILMSWIRLRTFFMTWDFKKYLNSSFFWSILHVLLKILSLFWNLLLFTIIYECRCNCSSVRLRGKCYYVNKVIKNKLDCFSGVCCMSWPKYIPHFEICYYFRLLMVLLGGNGSFMTKVMKFQWNSGLSVLCLESQFRNLLIFSIIHEFYWNLNTLGPFGGIYAIMIWIMKNERNSRFFWSMMHILAKNKS